MKFNYKSNLIPMLWLVMNHAIAENQTYKAIWQQFRGPEANSIAFDQNIPADVISEKNLIWKTQIPKGHSSATKAFKFAGPKAPRRVRES